LKTILNSTHFLKKILLILLIVTSFSSCKDEEKKPVIKIEEKKPEIRFGYKMDDFQVIQDTIKKGESFGIILDWHGPKRFSFKVHI